jgi:hypothetical protein
MLNCWRYIRQDLSSNSNKIRRRDFPAKILELCGCRNFTGCCPNRDLVTTPPYDEIDDLLI